MNIRSQGLDRAARRELFETRFGIHVRSRPEFIQDLKKAIETKAPFAVGGLGMAESHWMYYPLFLEEHPNKTKLAVFHRLLVYHAYSQSGIFPPQPSFFLRFNEFFVENVRRLDWLGLFLEPVLEPPILAYHRLGNKFAHHLDFIPDKSIPDDPMSCYLPFFGDRKILIVCSYGEFLKERAKQKIFEGVWSKTGKKWFYPASVAAVEFPYGYDEDTAKQYATTIDLFTYISARIAQIDFDIALIAAGALAVPIAAFVKSLGKIGFDLGGELQFLFGVRGKRWRDDDRWQNDYFTESWVDLPDQYRPHNRSVPGFWAFS